MASSSPIATSPVSAYQRRKNSRAMQSFLLASSTSINSRSSNSNINNSNHNKNKAAVSSVMVTGASSSIDCGSSAFDASSWAHADLEELVTMASNHNNRPCSTFGVISPRRRQSARQASFRRLQKRQGPGRRPDKKQNDQDDGDRQHYEQDQSNNDNDWYVIKKDNKEADADPDTSTECRNSLMLFASDSSPATTVTSEDVTTTGSSLDSQRRRDSTTASGCASTSGSGCTSGHTSASAWTGDALAVKTPKNETEDAGSDDSSLSFYRTLSPIQKTPHAVVVSPGGGSKRGFSPKGTNKTRIHASPSSAPSSPRRTATTMPPRRSRRGSLANGTGTAGGSDSMAAAAAAAAAALPEDLKKKTRGPRVRDGSTVHYYKDDPLSPSSASRSTVTTTTDMGIQQSPRCASSKASPRRPRRGSVKAADGGSGTDPALWTPTTKSPRRTSSLASPRRHGVVSSPQPAAAAAAAGNGGDRFLEETVWISPGTTKSPRRTSSLASPRRHGVGSSPQPAAAGAGNGNGGDRFHEEKTPTGTTKSPRRTSSLASPRRHGAVSSPQPAAVMGGDRYPDDFHEEQEKVWTPTVTTKSPRRTSSPRRHGAVSSPQPAAGGIGGDRYLDDFHDVQDPASWIPTGTIKSPRRTSSLASPRRHGVVSSPQPAAVVAETGGDRFLDDFHEEEEKVWTPTSTIKSPRRVSSLASPRATAVVAAETKWDRFSKDFQNDKHPAQVTPPGTTIKSPRRISSVASPHRGSISSLSAIGATPAVAAETKWDRFTNDFLNDKHPGQLTPTIKSPRRISSVASPHRDSISSLSAMGAVALAGTESKWDRFTNDFLNDKHPAQVTPMDTIKSPRRISSVASPHRGSISSTEASPRNGWDRFSNDLQKSMDPTTPRANIASPRRISKEGTQGDYREHERKVQSVQEDSSPGMYPGSFISVASPRLSSSSRGVHRDETNERNDQQHTPAKSPRRVSSVLSPRRASTRRGDHRDSTTNSEHKCRGEDFPVKSPRRISSVASPYRGSISPDTTKSARRVHRDTGREAKGSEMDSLSPLTVFSTPVTSPRRVLLVPSPRRANVPSDISSIRGGDADTAGRLRESERRRRNDSLSTVFHTSSFSIHKSPRKQRLPSLRESLGVNSAASTASGHRGRGDGSRGSNSRGRPAQNYDDSLTTLGSLSSPTQASSPHRISFNSLPSLSSDTFPPSIASSSTRHGTISLQSFRSRPKENDCPGSVKSRRRGGRIRGSHKDDSSKKQATTRTKTKSSFAAWKESLSRVAELPKDKRTAGMTKGNKEIVAAVAPSINSLANNDDSLPDPRPILMAARKIAEQQNRSSNTKNSPAGSPWRPSLPTLQSERLLCKMESERRFASSDLDVILLKEVENNIGRNERPRPPLREICFEVAPEPLIKTTAPKTATTTKSPSPSRLRPSWSRVDSQRGRLIRGISSHFKRCGTVTGPTVQEGPGGQHPGTTHDSVNEQLATRPCPLPNPRIMALRREVPSPNSLRGTILSTAGRKAPVIQF